MKPDLIDKKLSKLTTAQYKFLAEMIWGSVPVDRDWAEETGIFKEKYPKILKNYPMLDKSDFNIKRCKSFVTGVKRADGKVVMYVTYTRKKLIITEDDKGVRKKSLTEKNNADIHHVMKRKQIIYGYIFGTHNIEMDFKNSLAAGSRFV